MPRHRNNRVEGPVPCGNPRRYGSKDVLHMPPFGSLDKQDKGSYKEDDCTATESEKHLKTLLNQQLKTDVSLIEQFSHHRSFSLATSHDPEVEKLHGVHAHDRYKQIDGLDARIDYLRHCGLDDGEITLKLKEELKDKMHIPTPASGYGADPESKLEKLREIDRKIQEKEKLLKVPDTFRDGLELSRQALELEKSKSQEQGKEPTLTGLVATLKKCETTHPDDPTNHIHEILSDIERRKEREPRRDRRRKRKLERRQLYYAKFEGDLDATSKGEVREISIDSSPSSKFNVEHSGSFTTGENFSVAELQENTYNESKLCETHPELFCSKQHQSPATDCNSPDRNPVLTLDKLQKKQSLDSQTSISDSNALVTKNICKPVHFLSEEELIKNRVSMEEIQAMEKFQNYAEGEPNNVVYVKNLPTSTTEEDLVALFGQFHSEGQPKTVFRLMSGRMKGQAFITFPDQMTAARAIKLVNGFKLHGRPIILSFGKKQSHKPL